MLKVSTSSGNTAVIAQKQASASVSVARMMRTCKGDVNSALEENSKEPSSSAISFDDEINKEALNVNKFLSAITEKIDIKQIQILFAQVEQKVLWKILGNTFITKKYNQCKTPRTLKIVVFELPNNKNIGKLFSKYVLFFPKPR